MRRFKLDRSKVIAISLVVAVAALLIGITLYLMALPDDGLVLTDTRVVSAEDGSFTVTFEYYGAVLGAYSHTRVVVEYPNGEHWVALYFGDIAYSERRVADGQMVAFTAAIFQIDDRAWVIIDPATRTVDYQDDMPE